MRASESVVVVGTGKVVPAVAAAFASAGDRVVVAGRNTDRARDAALAAEAFAGAPVEAAAIGPEAFAGAAVVVECIAEKLDVKLQFLPEIEASLSADALLVSNTSSLPLDALAEALRRPERFAGLHFLHPAHLTRVVEVVPASSTHPRTTERLLAMVERMQKRSILVRRPVPGYVWNRLQMAMLRECLDLVEQGVADADAVDAAVAEGLAPRWLAAGPLATADAGGLATFAEVARQLFPVISAASEPPPLLVDAETRGGIYDWTPEEQATVERVRAEALGLGAAVAARRPQPRLRAAPATPPTPFAGP